MKTRVQAPLGKSGVPLRSTKNISIKRIKTEMAKKHAFISVTSRALTILK